MNKFNGINLRNKAKINFGKKEISMAIVIYGIPSKDSNKY